MNTATLAAGTAGRILGASARHLLWIERQIDWAEVGAILLHGLVALVVLTYWAGRYSRRAWRALEASSERLGRWYAALLVPPAGISDTGSPAVVSASTAAATPSATGAPHSLLERPTTAAIASPAAATAPIPASPHPLLELAARATITGTVAQLRQRARGLGMPRAWCRVARKSDLVALLAGLEVALI